MPTDRSAKRTGEMRAALAPVKTRSAKQAAGYFSIQCRGRSDGYTDARKELYSRSRHQTAIWLQFHKSPADHCISDGNAEVAGKMVIAGARGPQRGVAWTDRQPPTCRLQI